MNPETAHDRTVDRHVENLRKKIEGDAAPPRYVQDVTVILDTTGERRYRAVVDLSRPVDAASLRQVFSNGLLELRLQKV